MTARRPSDLQTKGFAGPEESTAAGLGEGSVSQVLVFSQHPTADRSEWQRVAEILPSLELSIVTSEPDYAALLEQREFQVVIFDWESEALASKMYLPELRLRNETPGILVVSLPTDPVTVATLYNAGCHRLVPKIEGWGTELSQAIRSMLRVKRAENAHERTRARLTEMLQLLEEKNKRLEEFSVTLAHDIRGPLAGISMKLDFILETYAGKLPERSGELMHKALDTSRRLTNIVQSMYEYARLGAKATKFEEVDLLKLVRSVAGDLHFDESLDIKLGVGELPKVWGSPDLLQRAFVNLITNAVKHSDKRAIVINIGSRGVSERPLGRYAEVFVSDNGPGIPPEEQSRLFTMFARGDVAAGKSEGLGAGLAVVQRVAELHFGRVTIESSPGSGTAFILSLPVGPVDLS